MRAGLAAYLQPPAVAGLGNVFAAAPQPARDTNLMGGLTGKSVAAAYIHLPRQHEGRIAMGGDHGGWKQRVYEIHLVVVFRSDEPEADAVVAAHDALMDALTARIQADRTWGGCVWQGGEGERKGGGDLVTDVGWTDPTANHSWIAATLTLRGVEMIQT